jgi:hypothetical protein
MNGFNFKNRQRLKICDLLIGLPTESISYKVGFQTMGLRETFHNQAFPEIFIDEITMAGFDLHFLGVGF